MKKIKEAAEKNLGYKPIDSEDEMIYNSFITGAMSEAAKEFHKAEIIKEFFSKNTVFINLFDNKGYQITLNKWLELNTKK